MKKYLSLVILCCLSLSHKASGADNPTGIPFHEITIDQEGRYDVDVDFDGVNEVIQVDESGNVNVVKIDKYGKLLHIALNWR